MKHFKRQILAAMLIACLALGACSDDDSGQNNNVNQNNAQALCGNGQIEGAEECDHGTENSDSQPNACRSDCIEPTCGDSVIDTGYGEECDDGAANSDTEPNTCRESCLAPYCGDSITDDATPWAEECDDGNTTAGDGCGPTCLLELCGNGYIDPGEDCDDTNDATGDGCGPTCLFEECGNGYVDTVNGELCDAGAYNSQAPDAPCRLDCQPVRCGDGVRDTNEECDHGAVNSATVPDACRPGCLTAYCGDGVTDSTEACDDGGNVDGDGCSADCRSLEVCGNGWVDNVNGELCDAGQYNSWVPNAMCRPDCQLAQCGDGVVDSAIFEECDDASDNSNTAIDACREDCLLARCGDGVIDSAEICDDDNDLQGDGCSPTCAHFEYGWNCNPTRPHNCVRCDDYRHGAACDLCAVLVDVNSPTALGDGANWFTAFRTVQEGIDQAYAVVTAPGGPATCDVWVAQGTYQIYQTGPTDTVTLRAGVEVYGGFTGVETARNQRDFQSNQTVLDGSDGQFDNYVYHVVSAIDTSNTLIDGFVITRGSAIGFDEDRHGAGVYGYESTFEVANCAIANNIASGNGGGLHSFADTGTASVTLTNCLFSANKAGEGGGAVNSEADAGTASLQISGTTITSNAANEGGGIRNYSGADSGVATLNIDGCVLSSNAAGDQGGGVLSHCFRGETSFTATDSHFRGNLAAYRGGGVYNLDYRDTATANFTGCIFAANDAVYGGAIDNHASNNSSPATATTNIADCSFATNTAGDGGAIYNRTEYTNDTATVTITGSTFSGNTTQQPGDSGDGGAIYNHGYATTTTATIEISNSVFAGNAANDPGGAIHNFSTSGNAVLKATNTTFTGNSTDDGAAIYNRAYGGTTTSTLTNCIIHGNIDTEGPANPSIFDELLGAGSVSTTVNYTNIEGGHAGTNNLNVDPEFLAAPGDTPWSGVWDAVMYDPLTHQTEFVSTAAAWNPQELIGRFVRPNIIGDLRWFEIADNTVTSIRIWGDLTMLATVADPYEIYDLHLASSSSCIDAGDGCTDVGTCDPLIPLTDKDGYERSDAPGSDVYNCGGTPEPQCVQYVDLGAYEFQVPAY